jgi:ABC-type lipoprotein release transport system permease subunit
LFAVVIRLAVAMVSVRLLESVLFGVQPNDALTYAGVSTLLIAMVLAACAVPAYRASRIAPGEALRAD